MLKKLWKRLCVMIALTVFITGCSGDGKTSSDNGEKKATTQESTFISAINYMPTSLFPQDGGSDDYTTMLRPIYDPLYYSTPEGYESRLAEKVDISEDGTKYTVHMNPNAKWSDGKPITTDDVLFTIAYGKIKSGGYSEYERINDKEVKINKIDDQTIEFVLPEPYAMYARRLGGLVPMPSHIFDNDASRIEKEMNYFYTSEMVTSGPYTVKEINNDSIVFQSREDYYLGKPGVNTLIMRTIGSGSTQNIAFKNGEISYMRVTTGEDLEKYKANPDQYNFFSVPEYRLNYLQINPYGPNKSALNEDARKAIMLAINTQEVIDAAYGSNELAEPANSMAGPGLSMYNPDIKGYEYNLKEAKKLAEKSGLKGKTLVYVYNADRPNMEQVATVLQQQLAQIGVNLSIEGLDSNTFFPRFFALSFDSGQENTWDLGTNGWDSDRGTNGGQSFSYFTHSKKAWGYSEEVSKLATEANATPDQNKAKEIYTELQEKALDECWIHPLTFTNYVMVAQKNVSGLDKTLIPEITDYISLEVTN